MNIRRWCFSRVGTCRIEVVTPFKRYHRKPAALRQITLPEVVVRTRPPLHSAKAGLAVHSRIVSARKHVLLAVDRLEGHLCPAAPAFDMSADAVAGLGTVQRAVREQLDLEVAQLQTIQFPVMLGLLAEQSAVRRMLDKLEVVLVDRNDPIMGQAAAHELRNCLLRYFHWVDEFFGQAPIHE